MWDRGGLMGGMRMSDFVKQCVLRRMKWRAQLCFAIAAPIALLLLIVGLAQGVSRSDLFVGILLPLGEAAIIFAVFLYQPVRFVRMIRRQEWLLGITFGEEEFAPTHPKASRLNQHYHSSNNWYMCEGSWAFHRLYIVKVTQKVSGARVGLQYHAQVETVEGKTCNLRMESASDLKRFYQWYKDGCI